MQCFILAGGFATRLWPLTEQRAKPLLPLAGSPIITRIVEKVPMDIPITVSTNAAFGTAFDEWKRTLSRTNVTVLVEPTAKDDEKLGALGATSHWIRSAHINDDLLLIAGDNECGFSISSFLAAARPGIPLLAAFDIGDRERARSFGTVIVDSDDRTVRGFEEKPKEPKTSLVATGCSLIPKEYLPTLVAYAKEHPDNIGGIFEHFLAKKIAVDCFRFTEPWFDIGSFEAYLEATRTLVGKAVVRGEGATVRDTECEGSVVLGAGTQAVASTLRDTVLFDNCRITNCVLEECIIDEQCVLEGIDLRRKMIRRNTQLKRETALD
jgi:glucose-1-phosphate thymidylyltransferase